VPRWGTQLILVLIAALFLAAGVSKLRHGGLAWADGKTLGFYLAGGTTMGLPQATWQKGFSPLSGPSDVEPTLTWKDGFGLENYLYLVSPPKLGRVVARFPWMAVILSVVTLIFELAAPLMIINHWLRNLYLLSAILFMSGIRFTMGIDFLPWIVVFLRRLTGFGLLNKCGSNGTKWLLFPPSPQECLHSV
jgi:hypothetical protein